MTIALDHMSFLLGFSLAAVALFFCFAVCNMRKKAGQADTGRLGNLAHELNNILTVISGNIELIEKQLGDNPELKEMAESTLASIDKGKKLIQLARSRKTA